MRERGDIQPLPGEPTWVAGVCRAQPEAPLLLPFMAYLLLLLLDGAFPDRLRFVPILLRAVGALWIAWAFHRRWPPLGRPDWPLAITAGLFAAWGWAAGQHLFDRLGLGGTFSIGALFSDSPALLAPAGEPFDLRTRAGGGPLFWGNALAKIGAASTVVPIVEELFWRGFLLRAFISWRRFESIPLGQFSWFALICTSLLSVLQHPSNWGVSILCWLFYNALFYWRKSLLCLMIAHGVTNLALYIYVVGWDDWRFW